MVQDHLRRDCRLVDEYETRRIELGLLDLQLGARGGDVRAILLDSVQRFF